MLRVISGKYNRRRIKEADKTLTRPTTDKNKEMVFNVLGQYFDAGIALDLFAGSGAMGIEALSRGVSQCYFVDKNKNPIQTVKENLDALQIPIGKDAFLFQQDYRAFLETHTDLKVDFVFLDPPYAVQVIPEIIQFLADHKMLSDTGVIVAETDKFTRLNSNIHGIIVFKEALAGNTRFAFYRWGDES